MLICFRSRYQFAVVPCRPRGGLSRGDTGLAQTLASRAMPPTVIPNAEEVVWASWIASRLQREQPSPAEFEMSMAFLDSERALGAALGRQAGHNSDGWSFPVSSRRFDWIKLISKNKPDGYYNMAFQLDCDAIVSCRRCGQKSPIKAFIT